MKTHGMSVVLGVVVLSSSAVLAQAPGQATGTMTVNGRTTRLTHAFAQVSKNDPDDPVEFVHVLLSDVPVPPLQTGSSALRKRARDGTLHAIEVTLTPDDTLGATIYDPSLSDGYVPAGFAQTFRRQPSEPGTVAGRLFTEGEGSFGEERFGFDATFKAVIAPYPLALTDADRAAIAAQKAGTATGEFTVGGQGTKLALAYAVARREFPGDPETLSVVLADAAIPDEVLLADFGMQELSRDGKVHAVQVEIGADGKAKGGQLYHRGFSGDDPERGSMSVSVSGMHHFLPVTLDANAVAGKLLMKEPDDFMGTGYHYAAVFRADVLRRPPPTFEGEAAARSAPGKAAAAFLRAARTGNRAAVRKLLDPVMGARLDGPDGPMMLKMLKATFPAGLKVAEVTQKGDAAEVVVMRSDKNGRESYKLRTVLRDGEWRMGMEGGEDEAAPPREPPTPEEIAAAATGPGKLVLAFADAIHQKDVARMRALSAEPGQLKDLEGPLADLALELLSKAFPWDLRILRVTQSGDTATVEAGTAMAKEPLKVRAVRVQGTWKVTDSPK